MCPKLYNTKQQGFLLPLALFIVIVMGLFSLVLARNSIQTSNATLLELVSTQAFYAAESGAQRGMQDLLTLNPTSRNAVDSRCASAFPATYTFTVTGLKNCSAVVACSCLYTNNTACSSATAANYSTAATTATLTSFYKISSVATCGSGNFKAVRTIEAGAFLKQE